VSRCKLIDRLLDLNPYELKQLRRALAPTKDFDARYEALGEKNPLKGRASVEKIVHMLGGVGHGHDPLPTTEAEAKAIGLDDLGKMLGEIEWPTAKQQRSWLWEFSVRGGKKGVFSFGYEQMFERTAEDRRTHKRKWVPYEQVFLRTPMTLKDMIVTQSLSGERFGANEESWPVKPKQWLVYLTDGAATPEARHRVWPPPVAQLDHSE
jgi:hypothetical protein